MFALFHGISMRPIPRALRYALTFFQPKSNIGGMAGHKILMAKVPQGDRWDPILDAKNGEMSNFGDFFERAPHNYGRTWGPWGPKGGPGTPFWTHFGPPKRENANFGDFFEIAPHNYWADLGRPWAIPSIPQPL